jgi:hypothetical protein
MRPLLVVVLDEVIELGLLLKQIFRRRLGGSRGHRFALDGAGRAQTVVRGID